MIRRIDCYIYGLRWKDSSVYFYVGSTKRAVSVRLENHLCNARAERGPNKHLIRKIRAVGPANVIADTLEVANEQTRFEREYHWINKLKHQGMNLCNILMAPTPPRTERTIEEATEILNSGPVADPLIEQFRLTGLACLAFLREAQAQGAVVV